MIETPQANLSRGMSLLNGMYTQRFNREHGRYQATSGKIAKPNFLHVNWLLSHFGNVKTLGFNL